MRAMPAKKSAWRRQRARFSVPDGAAVVHELDRLTLLDLAGTGCRIRVPADGVYAPGIAAEFRLILKSDQAVERRIRSVCRWVRRTEAGFEFEPDEDLESLIAGHLVDALRNGSVRVINGTEIS